MSIFTALRPLRAAVIGALAAAAAAGAAQAQGNSDVFVNVFADDQKPIVIYTFSVPASPALDEQDSIAFFAKPGYTAPEGQFNPAQACLISAEFKLADVPPSLRQVKGAAPIYGPNSAQKTIDPFALPSFMAREAVKMMIANKFVADEATAAPYFNCGGFVWSVILHQSPDTWRQIFKDLKAQ